LARICLNSGALALVLGFQVVGTGPLLAQTLPDTTETITVTATRTEQSLKKVGSSVTIVSEDQIKASQVIAVSDALATVTGVAISRNGGQGGLTSVRVRGAEADQTLVLIDGIKINDPASPGGGFDFGNLLVGDIDRIEVLRGTQSTLYGSQAIGGVVNVISKTPTGPVSANLDVETGDLASHRARAAVRGKFGAFSYGAGAGYVTTDGVSSAASGQEADGFEHHSLQGRVGYAFGPALDLEARAWWSKGKVGIDGFPPPNFVFSDTLETSTTEQTIFYLGANLVLLDGRSRTRFGLSQASTDRLNEDPTSRVTATFVALGRNEQFDVQTRLDLSPSLQIIAGGEFETSRLRVAAPNVFDPNPAPLRARTQTQGLYVQAQVTPTSWMTATLGVRQTSNARFGDALNAQATFVARFNGDTTSVRVAIANGFKAPTLYQSLSEYGNLELQPEEASSYEFGVEQAFFARKLIGSVTYFARDVVNQIDFASCFGVTRSICTNRPFGVYDNIAAATAEGIEAALDIKPRPNLAISLGYTALDASNQSRGSGNFGKNLARRPRQSDFVSAAYDFAFGLNLSATYTRVGKSFNDGGNRQRLDGYDLISVRASQRINENWSIYARVENATDEFYQSVAGYGGLPRQAFVGLRATF
jgi:vitamin B12 transporter